jgi:hypothetical protein
MGVLKLFTSIVGALQVEPDLATANPLDAVVEPYARFAYIGNRRTLSTLVTQEASELMRRLSNLSDDELQPRSSGDNQLVKTVAALKHKRETDASSVVAQWFGQDWKKDSGIYPDFVLGLDATATFGNGAFLELKDSETGSIASFNSTLPSRFKALKEAKHLTVSAAQLYDFPWSVEETYLSHARQVFYLVRTSKKKSNDIRISLVEGAFFETLPTHDLLVKFWEQILSATNLNAIEQARVTHSLSKLTQEEIVKLWDIEKASVRPQLSLVADVHQDAELHHLSDIPPRTVNLVVKQESGYDAQWFVSEFAKEGLTAQLSTQGDESIVSVFSSNHRFEFRVFTLQHKRNGLHLVLQHQVS